MTDFKQLPLAPELHQALEVLDYAVMTPVQAATLPSILAGRDVIAQARTGSGKTAAFGLGLLSRLDADHAGVQALVLCPTRELADQVGKEIRRLARFLPNTKVSVFCGGVPLRPHLASLVHPPQVVVGTPGRVQELIDEGALVLDGLRTAVLDEADRMLDMGFEPAIAGILGQAPAARQTLMFSATFPEEIRALGRRFQRQPEEHTVSDGDAAVIEQRFYEVEAPRKADALALLLGDLKPESALVFCNTRRDVQQVAEDLAQRGFAVMALHGDLEQRDRDEVLVCFGNRSCQVLVATDVAARGLDIKDLPLVVSHGLASDVDTHTHRIGRTGRAGEAGLALALVAGDERRRVAGIEERLGGAVRWERIDLSRKPARPAPAVMTTLVVDAGRQDKLRPGDLVGALTGEAGLAATAIGKIDGFPTRTYVAIERSQAQKALERLRAGKIKGRNFRVRKLG
ncbi:ATP-dependent RNA helicase DbpA [Arenimonas sp. MALMAid1274]|uniref:ATP-dependent RNA helicase DbpA n=1 Tax=Arenimonas sp. MALMAid1274 TaxID=3411630 RepID=UPI003B9EBBA4